jgi:hypothetical protein
MKIVSGRGGGWCIIYEAIYVIVLYPQFLMMMMMIMAVTGRSRNEKNKNKKIPIRVMEKQHRSLCICCKRIKALSVLQKPTPPLRSFIVGTTLEPSVTRGGIKVLGKGRYQEIN